MVFSNETDTEDHTGYHQRVREQQISCRVRLGRQVSSLMIRWLVQMVRASSRVYEHTNVIFSDLQYLDEADWSGETEILVQQQPSTFSCTPTENHPRVVHSKAVFGKRNIEEKGQSNLALRVSSSLIKPFCSNMTAEIPSSARLSAGLRSNDKTGYTEMEEIAFCCF